MIDENTAAIFDIFQEFLPQNTLLVGMGNTLKADDGIGPEICARLKGLIPDNVIDAGTVPENYIQVIIKKNPKVVLFIDAIDFQAPAGTIRLFEAAELSMAGVTTHTLSPRLLGKMISQSIPAKIFFVGIQPKSTVIGHSMGREVSSAKDKLFKLFTHVFSLNDFDE
jgi:hydrogenase 3 maturation protease